MIEFSSLKMGMAVAAITMMMFGPSQAETIRVAVGTQDTTINCATGGLLIRELKLLEKFLPHDGKYKDATYDIQWKNFTSGAPLTNEMVAGKLDFAHNIAVDSAGAIYVSEIKNWRVQKWAK